MIDHPLSDADTGEARQGVAHPVYSPRKTPAVAVEQGPLEREDEEMAAAEAAEQEYLQLQETTIVEQSPRQEEDEEMAAAKTTKQDYLQQEEKERAVAAAQEQEQAQQEAANTAEQEWLEKEREAEERTAQDRALALAHLEQGNKKSFAQSNAILFERSSSTTQLDLSMDVPSIITQLRQPSDSPDRDQSPVIELYGLATQSLTKTASGSHTTEAATGEISPQRTVTTALEPITEEVEVSSPRSSVIIESDRQRQLREQAAERRRADKEKVENSKRSVVEEDETFIRTHGTEDLFTDESVNEVVIPPELPTAPLLPSDSASDRPQQDRIQATDTATSAETTEPLPQVIVTQTQPKPKPGRKPQGIQKARKSGQARGKEATKCASIDPSARPLTQMEFHERGKTETPAFRPERLIASSTEGSGSSAGAATSQRRGRGCRQLPNVSTEKPAAVKEEPKVEEKETVPEPEVQEEQKEVADERTCNACFREFSESTMVHCDDCEDYDLCIGCLLKNVHGHNPAHAFSIIKENQLGLKNLVLSRCRPGRHYHHAAICDGCEKRIVGVRHKCLSCPD